MNGKRNNTKIYLLVILGVIIIAPMVWILMDRMEGEIPKIEFALSSPSIGKSLKLPVTLADEKSGIQRFWVALVKDGKEYPILTREFDSGGLLVGGLVRTNSIIVDFKPQNYGISDGKAVLRMAVWDYSWRKWGKGNQFYVEQDVIIDTQPPRIEVISRAHNVNQGGAGLVIYKLSEPCIKNGILVGERFFPGRSGYFSDADIQLVFFALTYKQGSDTKLTLTAMDNAGNESKGRFPYHINSRKFKNDTINISDRFLESKMPEFAEDVYKEGNSSPLNTFLLVNEKLRRANSERVYNIAMSSESKMFWDGEFLRLPNAANRANFADRRSYVYNGKTIDTATHMGIDLASVAQSPIPAANNGKVLFAGDIGIYGGTVLIDHGFGLVSLYGHMSSIDVTPNQMVAKGDIIGKTGVSGLAGGDHLHFGMLIHNTYVNPIEWWDESWIRNNITSKIVNVR
ncbi:MAG: M23 family metallopeptidase [Desulfobacteraceae bacterium]